MFIIGKITESERGARESSFSLFPLGAAVISHLQALHASSARARRVINSVIFLMSDLP